MTITNLPSLDIEYDDPPKKTWDIKLVPVSILSTPIAIFGLSLTWKKTTKLYEFVEGKDEISTAIVYIATFCTICVFLVYFLKYWYAKEKVLEEWRDHQRFHLFANFSLHIVWISLFFNEFEKTKDVAVALWYIGATLHLLYSLLTIRCWIHSTVELTKISPLYFFPFMTNFIPAMIGPLIEGTSNELAWFSYSIAIIFFAALFVIWILVMITSAVFPVQTPDSTPSTSILAPNSGLLTWLIVPFCIGSVAYVNITKQYDYFAMLLYFGGVFNTMLCVVCADELINNGNPFAVGWHASTFPFVGLASSTLDFYHYKIVAEGKENISVKWVALLAVWLVSAYVAAIWIATLVQVARKKMFVEPPRKPVQLVNPIVSTLLKKNS